MGTPTVSPRIRIRVTAPAPSGDTPSAPAWMQSLTTGVWATGSTNTLSSVDPAASALTNPNYPSQAPWAISAGQRNLLNAWNGGTIATPESYSTHGAWMIYGGGHGAYQGSEVYALDFASRQFTRLSDPYAGDCSVAQPSGWYPDDSPIPTHTYDAIGWHPGSKSFVVLRGNTVSSTALSSNTSDLPIASMFDTDAGTWRKSPTDTFMAHHSGMKSCYDSENDCFWLMGANVTKMVKFSGLTAQSGGLYGTWTGYNWTVTGTSSADAAAIDGGMCYDPEDDLLLCSSFRASTKKVFGFRVVNGALVSPGFTITTTAPPFTIENAVGWEYSVGRRAIIYYRRNGEVWELKKPASVWQTNAWTWSLITSASNSLIPPNKAPEDNGVYGCFNLVRYADMEVVIAVTRVDQAALVMRIF